MTAITWLADVLRSAGVKVVEEGDWRARSAGGNFNPIGVLWHHTAGSNSGPNNPHPSLGLVISGRPDLPGPLCHALVDYNGVFHLIAAGPANHAGPARASGPIPAGAGNAMLIGWEIDYSGDQPYPQIPDQAMSPAQYDASVKATAAVLKHLGRDASYARGHRETSTTSKIDPSYVDLDRMRADVAQQTLARLSNVAVYRGSTSRFYIRTLDGSGQLPEVLFGQSGDLPAVGHYENSAYDNLAVYRPSDAAFYLRMANGTVNRIQFGATGDLPAPGHYENSAYDNLAVYRPSDATFYLRWANGTAGRVQFGEPGDLPAIGHYENSVYDNLAVYRPSTATFHIRMANGTVSKIQYGNVGDLPAPGYFEGLAYTNLAVYRPSTNSFYIRKANLSTQTVVFGAGNLGDVPAIGKFQ
ncbi:N-acetylmuramoyl-L-alanine amidase [Micromonospora sp. NPDC005324]|uniref:peptidoglycan recognition protein family protein n=1 Tax=Micromonospora sp. NPDC005324 TaxID=3157033 RepID=UPI0033B5DA52